MRPLRAIALDVDGTLLNHLHQVSPAVAHAVADVRRRGMQVMLASARHVGSLARLLGEMRTEGLAVAFSGAAAARVHADMSFDVLFENKLSADLAQDVAQQALGLGLDVGWYSSAQWYAPSSDGWYVREATILRQHPVIVPGLRGLDWAPNKLQLVGHSPVAIKRLHALRATLPPECTAVFSHDDMLEVLPLGTNKAAGLARLGALSGIALDEIAAFGDAENDIEMLREAGVGVAMGQAPEAVKAAADRITLSNRDDGVAVALAQEWLQQHLLASTEQENAL